MKKTKDNKLKVVEQTEETSSLYYFYSMGCAFCKKLEPIVDELIKEGHNILKLDTSEPENKKISDTLSKEYNKQCGTPWLIDASNGNQVCGWRDKETIMKWIGGEDIPSPPTPNGMPPRVLFMTAKKSEVKEYEKWKEENKHLPNLQPVENIVQNFKRRRDQMQQQQQQQNPQGLNSNQEARLTRLEQKMDKLMKHLGVK